MKGSLSFGRLKSMLTGSGRRRILAQEFAPLIDFLRRSGCTFHSCTELGAHPVPRGVSFRYDVHVRDIQGCLPFIEFHEDRKIPATFFWFWDYSSAERARLADFSGLNGHISPPLEIGLHDSPADAYLIAERFGGDRRGFANWLPTPDAREWFVRLSGRPEELRSLNEAILDAFRSRVERTRDRFGPISAIAAHGGEMTQTLRDRLEELGPGGPVARGLFARFWLTPERIAAAGLQSVVDHYDRFASGWREVSDGEGQIELLAGKLRESIAADKAVQLLLHPYTWAGGERDAEFSRVLFIGKPIAPHTPAAPIAKPRELPVRVESPFFGELQSRWPVSPNLSSPVSQLCTASQFREPEYARVCKLLAEKPRLHRKQWEFVYAVRCLERFCLLRPGRKGLGFAIGREKLPAAFASRGCEIVATGWVGRTQVDLSDLNFPKIIARDEFSARVSLRQIDPCAGLQNMRDFDFCWSSSAPSHLGSVHNGLSLMHKSLGCLGPGGVAVHTLEFGLDSGDEGIENGPVSVFCMRDILRFAEEMRAAGHELTLNLNPGSEPEDLQVDRERNSSVHLKLYIGETLATGLGLCIRKAP